MADLLTLSKKPLSKLPLENATLANLAVETLKIFFLIKLIFP